MSLEPTAQGGQKRPGGGPPAFGGGIKRATSLAPVAAAPSLRPVPLEASAIDMTPAGQLPAPWLRTGSDLQPAQHLPAAGGRHDDRTGKPTQSASPTAASKTGLAWGLTPKGRLAEADGVPIEETAYMAMASAEYYGTLEPRDEFAAVERVVRVGSENEEARQRSFETGRTVAREEIVTERLRTRAIELHTEDVKRVHGTFEASDPTAGRLDSLDAAFADRDFSDPTVQYDYELRRARITGDYRFFATYHAQYAQEVLVLYGGGQLAASGGAPAAGHRSPIYRIDPAHRPSGPRTRSQPQPESPAPPLAPNALPEQPRLPAGPNRAPAPPATSEEPTNFRGEPVRVPEGHVMSPRDPAMSAQPITDPGPYTSAERDAMLSGNSGGTLLAPHHRHQIPTAHGGVIDELPGPRHPAGNQHTAGSPSRHAARSVFRSLENGEALRRVEIKEHWQAKGERLIEVAPGEWVDPGH